MRGKKKEEKVLTARVVIQDAGTHMPVEVMNPLDEDVVLYKLGSFVGCLTLEQFVLLKKKVYPDRQMRHHLNYHRS